MSWDYWGSELESRDDDARFVGAVVLRLSCIVVWTTVDNTGSFSWELIGVVHRLKATSDTYCGKKKSGNMEFFRFIIWPIGLIRGSPKWGSGKRGFVMGINSRVAGGPSITICGCCRSPLPASSLSTLLEQRWSGFEQGAPTLGFSLELWTIVHVHAELSSIRSGGWGLGSGHQLLDFHYHVHFIATCFVYANTNKTNVNISI